VYNVLVVDDEPLVRLTLKNLNDWESFGFFFGYEAAHGKQAIDILQGKEHIDLVIVDLNMPVMNGLELIEWLQFLNEKPEILILSCHNDFHLVRKAFKLGVHDYVLKTEMEPDTMLAHLKEVASRLDRSAKRKAQEAALSQIERQYLRKQLLKDLLNGQVDHDVSAKAQQFEIRLQAYALCLASLFINSFDLVKPRYEPDKLHLFADNVINLIAQILARQPYGEVLSLNEEQYVVFLAFDETESDCVSRIYTIIREIEQSLQHYLNVSITYGLSDFGAGFDAIHQLYKEAEQRKTLESRIVRKAKRYILEHFSDPDLDLQEISESVGITRNHLSYQFAKETGEHLRDYIHRIRIEEAKKLLVNTEKKVYEVCDLVGYKNVESFSRIFKKLTGVSPNRYSRND
jgi:two-component system response regulator YesN